MGDLSGNPRVADHLYWPVTLTVPASTPASAPATVLPFTNDKYIEAIEVEVPPGHSGLTGIAVTYDGVNIVPWSPTAAWITADNYVKEFDVGMVMGAQLTIAGYNTDVFAHTFYVRIKVRYQATGAPAPPAAPPSSGGITVAPPVTVLQPVPPTPLEVPPVSLITPPLHPQTPLLPVASPVATDPAFLALVQRVAALEGQVLALDAKAESLIQRLTALLNTTTGPNPVQVTTPPPAGAPAAPPQATVIPGAPGVTLPGIGQTVPLPNGQQVNPYNPNGSLNISAVGQVVAASGGSANVTLPSGAVIPVTVSTLGGQPYT